MFHCTAPAPPSASRQLAIPLRAPVAHQTRARHGASAEHIWRQNCQVRNFPHVHAPAKSSHPPQPVARYGATRSVLRAPRRTRFGAIGELPRLGASSQLPAHTAKPDLDGCPSNTSCPTHLTMHTGHRVTQQQATREIESDECSWLRSYASVHKVAHSSCTEKRACRPGGLC